MRKAQKQEILECVDSLRQAHEEIKGALGWGNRENAQNMLGECQEFAISLGENIEKLEGEGHPTVSCIEGYCEVLFHVFEEIGGGTSNEDRIDENKIDEKLQRRLTDIENSVKNDIHVRIEVAFFPYNVSMWDSLESVYLAARQDPDCDAYCVPIPYYELNPDGSPGRLHYDGGDYPGGIEVIDWRTYRFEERRPDVIFIHNPYDDVNFVTRVEPRYYSANLKKYTDCLVYIPYYATAGGMSKGQKLCPAYLNADYIVIQSAGYRKFFDERIPDSKFLAFGSPKFDKVVQRCQNPPEPPAAWKEKMERRDGGRLVRKKVYFYNTSIGGMLGDTPNFLKKMMYVFEVFRECGDVCLLWRPHPLMESTFTSMRPQYRPYYEALKQYYISESIGIYDDTPDITDAVALSDAYVGDAATSVTSLFGVAGKPLFIIDNTIHVLPQEDDWRGRRVSLQFDRWGDDRYQVTATNQLWFSERNDYHYRFYMDLVYGHDEVMRYMKALEIGEKIYVLPVNAQHLLVIEDKKIRKVEFVRCDKELQIFNGYWYNEKYIFLFPNQYPYMVRFHIKTEKIDYIGGVGEFNVRFVEEESRTGGRCVSYGNEIIFASPVDNEFLFLDIDTLRTRRLSSRSGSNLGTQGIVQDPYGDDLWLLPLNGLTLTRWNPRRGEVREYDELPEGFRAVRWPDGTECRERPFGGMVFSRESGRENIVIAPYWGNMYVTLDRETGRMEEWKHPLGIVKEGKNIYFPGYGVGGFVVKLEERGTGDCKFWHGPERKLYHINIDTGDYREIPVEFDYEEIKEHEPGFVEGEEKTRYYLYEDVFNSLKSFIEGAVIGKPFDRKRQLELFSEINANTDGTCGREVYAFVKGKVGK